jgi:cytohesin
VPTEPATREPPTEEATEDLSGLDQDALNELLVEAIRADDMPGIQRTLEAGADASHELSSGPIIIVVATKGNAEALGLLIEHGADPNAVGGTGHTPLTMGAHQGHTSVIEVLLDAGVDPNQPDGTRTDATALVNAADEGHVEVVELLLERGADPNLGDRQGETPLMFAAKQDVPQSIEALLAHGADVNQQSSGGFTALHGVAESTAANVEVLQLLLDAGADVSAETNMGTTPVELALSRGNEEIAERLRQAGGE